ncbi:MAG: PepSY domain-containing protein, partial [Porphyromonas sp.]|nr:PepSY domain-containing protein [Porphyromonas sp.]
WLSGLGAIMCFAGIIMGIYSYAIVWKRRKRFRSPYKKWDFKWHHITGFFFGFFVFMFILSGFMSLNDLPKWFMKEEDNTLSERLFKEEPLTLGEINSDYRAILAAYPGEVKGISFKKYEDHLFYGVRTSEKELTLDIIDGVVKPLNLTKDEVEVKMSKVLKYSYSMSLMTEYDNYYVGRSERDPLPVYRVEVEDNDKTVLYVSPETGRTRYYTARSRAERWIYPIFHTFRIKFFAEHPVLREVFLWIILLGGIIVSFTGVVLGLKYLKRLFTRKKKR